MSSSSLLRLVVDAPGAHVEIDPVQRLFSHWVFMLGKNPRRCALGPARRKLVAQALLLYDEETLTLAIDGCSASAWHAGDNDRGRAFNDIELIFRDEAHVERFVADGERLRARLLDEAAHARAMADQPAVAEPAAEVAAAREALRAMAQRLRGGA